MTKIGSKTITTQTEVSGKGIYSFVNSSWSGILGYKLLAPVSTPYRVAVLLQSYITDVSNSSGIVAGFIDSTGALVYMFLSSAGKLQSLTNSSVTGTPSVLSENATIGLQDTNVWFGMRNDGTHAFLEYSRDGVNFSPMGQENIVGGFLLDYTNLFWGWLNDGFDTSLTLRCWDTAGLTRTFP